MSVAEVVLLTANAVYGSAYVIMRPAIEAAGPVTLAFLRLLIGLAMVAPAGLGARGAGAARLSAGDHRTLFWMGFVGFTLAMALASGSTLLEAARMANRAAGIVVGKFGPATASLEEITENS